MPAPLYYAHLILRRISELRRNDDLLGGRACCPTPKARSRCATSTASRSAPPRVVVSTQHEEGMDQAEIKRMLWPIMESSLPHGLDVPGATSSTSTRPASSSSAARTAIAA